MWQIAPPPPLPHHHLGDFRMETVTCLRSHLLFHLLCHLLFLLHFLPLVHWALLRALLQFLLAFLPQFLLLVPRALLRALLQFLLTFLPQFLRQSLLQSLLQFPLSPPQVPLQSLLRFLPSCRQLMCLHRPQRKYLKRFIAILKIGWCDCVITTI